MLKLTLLNLVSVISDLTLIVSLELSAIVITSSFTIYVSDIAQCLDTVTGIFKPLTVFKLGDPSGVSILNVPLILKIK